MLELIEDFFHHFKDIFYVIYWILENLYNLFNYLLTPFKWIFNFVSGFFSGALTESSTSTAPFSFSTSTLQAFDSFPYLNLIFIGLGATITILMVAFFIKKIIHI